MVYRYEVIEFDRTFETEDEVEVVAAQLSSQGTMESKAQAKNRALVKSEIEETYVCGAELDSGDECGRSVEDEDARCWQHD